MMDGAGDSARGFIRSFVPRSIARDAGLPETRGDRAGFHQVDFPAAVAFVDLVGFAAATEKYERMGPEGVETFSAALNRVFGVMIDAIAASGGEISALPGDALIAYWRAPSKAALPGVARRALDGVQALMTLTDLPQAADGGRLAFHAGFATGRARLCQTGRGDGHRLWFLAGDAMAAAEAASDRAEAGELVVAEGAEIADAPMRLPPREEADAPSEAQLARYIPPSLRPRIMAGQQSWLDELRFVSAAFISCPDMGGDGPEGFARLQAAATTVKAVVDMHGGALQGLLPHDGQAEFLAAFGIPGLARDDDADRATTAMVELRAALAQQGVAAHAAVASGPAFCGLIGSPRWRTYSIRGSAVNRAARLLSAAMKGPPALLIDAATQAACDADAFEMEPVAPLRLKGIPGEVPASRVIAARPRDAAPRADAPIAGRQEELARLETMLDALTFEGQAAGARAAVVEGTPGIGKSALLAAAAAAAAARGFRVLRSGFDGGRVAPVYAAWRAPVRAMLRLEGRATPSAAALAEALDAAGEDPRAASALAAALGAPVRAGEEPGQAERADAAILGLLRRAADRGPVALVLDDAERLDTASLRVAQAALAMDAPVALLIGVRTEREAAAGAIEAMLARPRVELLALSEVDVETAGRLAAARLGAAEADPELARLIHAQAAGNPLFVQELAQALMEQGLLALEDGRAGFAAGRPRPAEADLPPTLDRLVVSRVDRLDVEEQLTLKVASVVGRRFTSAQVGAVHPLQPEDAACRAQCEDLAARRLTPAEPAGGYAFLHAAIHRAVYGMLTFSARRELHGSAARSLEAGGIEAEPVEPLTLAGHWLAAEEPARARPHLAAAGLQAMRASADPEAREALDRALEIEPQGEVDPIDEARLRFALGEVESRLGDGAASRRRFGEGLALLGERWPQGRAAVGRAILREAGVQMLRRRRGPPHARAGERNARALAVSHGLQKYGHLFFFEQSLEEMTLAILQTLNRAEDSGDPAEIRRACGQFMLTLDVAGAKGWAEAYARHAETGLPEAGEGPVRSHLALHRLNRGEWAAARRWLTEGLAASAGDRRLELDLRVFERSMLTLLGDYAEAQAKAEAHFRVAETSHDVQHRCYARVAKAELALRQGRRDEAKAWLEEARAHLLPAFVDDALMLYGPLAEIRLAEGDAAEAWRLATEQLARIRKTPSFGYYAADAMACVAWTLVRLAEGAPPPGATARETAQAADRAVKAMDGLARRFPPAEPRAGAIRARRLAGQGRAAKAVAAAEQAVRRAQALEMRFDEAVARQALAHARGAGPDARAQALLEELGLSAPGLGAWPAADRPAAG
ncbi:AAA family ATPase [Albimonas sp. CAU 1670]|uniref:AAA family ATPase n=1 Tax=Albimonas sp. CAU 1670 TaxID=3032599 RepID=UPI0023DC16B5|nr:AAA family ATPase [Albimonas sp. CAU 1670]MDF2235048.1 AAA family ATPase [Albimonas sp. CAU 1670]